MMKFNKTAIFILAALSIIFASCEPQEKFPQDLAPDNELDTTNQIVFQYCSDKINSAAGQETKVGNIYKQSAAIKITADQISTFASNRMIKILVGLPLHGESPSKNFKDLTVWIRTDLNSENIWEQKYEGKLTLGKWHEALMSPYFKINGEAPQTLYIGYTIEADYLIIGGDGSQNPNQEATYIFDWESRKWINYGGIGNLSIKAVFAGEHMPKNDASLVSFKAPKYVKPGEPFSVAGIVKNELVNEIESFDIVAKCGKKKVHKTVTLPWSLRKGESIPFFAQDIKFNLANGSEIEYYIDNINGSADDDNMRNSTVEVKTVISKRLVKKTTILENMTGDRCGNCPQGHRYLDDAMTELGQDHFIWVAHHAGFNRGKYTSEQSDSVARLFFAIPGGMGYAPALMIDRTNISGLGVVNQGGEGPLFLLNEAGEKKRLTGYMDVMQKEYSPINLDLQCKFDYATRLLSVTVKGDVLAELPREELNIVVAIIEDNLKGTQAGVSGTYYHNHVCRDAFTSILGNKLQVSKGHFEYSAKKTLDAKKFNADNVSVVAWIANRPLNRFDPNGHVIYQAVQAKIK